MTDATVTQAAGPVAPGDAVLRRCARRPAGDHVGMLIIPVSLQIFSRYTELIPSYIWTEEMARFMFIWTIMIGAMIGVREVDPFRGRPVAAGAAAARGASRGCSAVSAFSPPPWCSSGPASSSRASPGPHLGAGRPAALVHPRRLAGDRRDLDRLPRRADRRRPQDHLRESRVTGAVLSPGMAALILFGCFFFFMFCACRSRSRWRSPACRFSRSSRGSTR